MKINFGKGGMKKLIEEKILKNNSIQGKEIESYFATFEQKVVKANSLSAIVAMIREAKAIKKIIGWNDLLVVISIKVFLHEDIHDGLHDAIVEEKNGKALLWRRCY